MHTGSYFSICITNRLTFLSIMTLQTGKNTDNIYLQQTSEPGWLTLMSAASQEVFQHSCLGAVGQTRRGFPANTHQNTCRSRLKTRHTLFSSIRNLQHCIEHTSALCAGFGTTKAQHKSPTDKPP